MRSPFVAAAVLALASLVAVPAFAAPAAGAAPTETHRPGGHRAEGGDKGKKHFPMPAAEFKAKVDKRQARARARMEERVGKMEPAAAKDERAKFDAALATVNAEVAKACADGTVTADEAKAVRAASPHHHGKHARHGTKGGAAK